MIATKTRASSKSQSEVDEAQKDKKAKEKPRKDEATASSKTLDEKKEDKAEKDKQMTMEQFVQKQSTASQESVKLDQIMQQLTVMSAKMNSMITRDYFDEKLENLVTKESLLNLIEDVKTEMKADTQKDISRIDYEIRGLRNQGETTADDLEVEKGRIFDVESDTKGLAEKIDRLEKRTQILEECNANLQTALTDSRTEINRLNQYTRSESVRIFGIPDSKLHETVEESIHHVITVISTKLQMHITAEDISIAHRVGIFKKGASRPIVCKFVSRMSKIRVIQLRRKLKGTSVVIQEDLTQHNQGRLKEVSRHMGVTSAWTSNGHILAKLLNDRIVRIPEDGNLSFLLQEAYNKPKPPLLKEYLQPKPQQELRVTIDKGGTE